MPKLAVAALITLLMALTVLEGGVDGKRYPGAICVTDDESAALIVYKGSVRNRSPFPVKVSCPVMRDSGTIKMMRITGSAQQPIRCYLWLRGLDGTIKDFKSALSHPGLYSDIVDFGPLKYYPYGYYALECILPAAPAVGPSPAIDVIYYEESD